MARRAPRDRRFDKTKGVVVYGLDGTKRLLRTHAPELKKEMDKIIRQDILGPVQRSAKSNVPQDAPLSNWNRGVNAPGSRRSYSPYGRRWDYARLEWDPGQIMRKIVIRQGGGRVRGQVERAAWQLRSDDPAANVWELMGRGKSNVNMVRTVRRMSGQTGRILYNAWDNSTARGTAPKQIIAVVREYEAKLQQQLNDVGDA